MFIAQKSASLIKERERGPRYWNVPVLSMEYIRKWPNSDTIIFINPFLSLYFTSQSHHSKRVHSIRSKYPTHSYHRPRNLNDAHDWLFRVHFFFLSPVTTETPSMKSTVVPFCNNNGTFNKWNTFYHTVKCCKLKEQWYPMKSTHR